MPALARTADAMLTHPHRRTLSEDTGIHLPRCRRDLRAVIAWSLTLGGSLLAAEWRLVVLGDLLISLVANEH